LALARMACFSGVMRSSFSQRSIRLQMGYGQWHRCIASWCQLAEVRC
jgi:hypothetical protein